MIHVPTKKLEALAAVPSGVVTLIGPVVAPAGTVALIDEEESAVKTAGMPLNSTAVGSDKLDPLMVVVVPTSPQPGKKPVIAGFGETALTAAAASSMPLPHRAVVQVLPDGNGLAVALQDLQHLGGCQSRVEREHQRDHAGNMRGGHAGALVIDVGIR